MGFRSQVGMAPGPGSSPAGPSPGKGRETGSSLEERKERETKIKHESQGRAVSHSHPPVNFRFCRSVSQLIFSYPPRTLPTQRF